jgi:Tfp pilus assembly protein PilN
MVSFVKLWHFWCREHSKIIPEWVHLPGLRFSHTTDIIIASADDFFDNPTEKLKSAIRKENIKNARIRLLLDTPDIIKRDLKLPIASQKHCPSALRLNLQKQSILPLSKLLWIDVVRNKKNGSVFYTQYVAKNSLLQDIHSLCLTLKVDCRSIGAVGVDQDFVKFQDPLKKPTRVWKLINVALLCGVFLWWVGGHLKQQAVYSAEITALETDIIDLRENAVKLTAQQNKTAANEDSLVKLFDTFQNGRGVTEILAVLTKALPDDTWVSEFHFSGNNILLSGFTKQDVLELLNGLKSLKQIEKAELIGAVSGSRASQAKRFSVQLSLSSRVQP